MYENGFMNDCEWLMYNHFFEYFALQSPKISGIIYLDCEIEHAMKNIEERQRKGENMITVKDQKSLKEKHDKWLESSGDENQLHYGIPLHKIQAPYDTILGKEDETIDNILRFFNDLTEKEEKCMSDIEEYKKDFTKNNYISKFRGI